MEQGNIRLSVEQKPRGGADRANILAAITCPVLFVQADSTGGGGVTDEYLESILPQRDNFPTRKILGAGHNINWEHSELLLPVVLTWLEALPRP